MIISESFKHEDVLGFKFGFQLIGKPKMFSHIYFVDGLLIIDTGQSKARNNIKSKLKNLDVKQIFITNHHEDHTGNIDELKKIYNCRIYAPQECCQIMKNPPNLSFAQKITWGNRGAQTDLIPKNDEIKTNKFCFKIIPIPGHASDMVALYEPDEKWLFSADLYINSYIDYFIDNESITDQIESIKKILELDFKELFCSHRPELTNGKQHLLKKLNFLETFFNDVSSLYQKGYTANEIFKHLKLKENWVVKLLSTGSLSKLNMVNSVIRDLKKRKLINNKNKQE